MRSSLGLGFIGRTWPERWVSLDVSADLTKNGYDDTTYQVDAREGAVVRRLPGTALWRYVFTEPSTAPEQSLDLRARERLRAVLGAAGADPDVVVSTGRMHERAASSFKIGRVVLAGQAAHVANPLTVFSTTGEFLDAYSLVETLTNVIGSSRDDGPLDGWADARRRAFLEVTVPWSADRKHLVFQIADPAKPDAELEPYRTAAASPSTQRDFLLGELQTDG